MGKKRKAGGKLPVEMHEEPGRQNVQTRYDVDEQFVTSEDEFFAGRDKILLEEGPASKRRRKLEEEGRYTKELCPCST
jgi:U3 small nucleolar RNA-associated protein 3